jgi:CheY-like chemotaxis protein
VTLPLSPSTSRAISGAPGLGARTGAKPGLRILLVDDDDLVQTAMSAQLHRLGHSVVIAENGREALDRVEAGLQIDLVLLDIDMPVLDGTQTLPLLRKLRPDLPVVIETGNLGEWAEQLARGHQDVAVLVRPFSLAELKAAIDPWIARVAATRDKPYAAPSRAEQEPTPSPPKIPRPTR